MMREQGKVSPNDGGCWYCHNKDEGLVFCMEFDTFIHIDCIKEQIASLPPECEDQELKIIAREFDLWPDEDKARAELAKKARDKAREEDA
jgi:hypothetical protein